MFNFLSPKGDNKEPRPLNLCRLEEQILAVAIFQIKGKSSFDFHPRSYAYRLSDKKSGEFLYENWFKAYVTYIGDARNVCEKHPDLTVIRTDIKSYYTRIRQDDLQEKLIHSLKAHNSRVADVIHLLLKRSFDWEENLGIPQGHATSGLISDIYLQAIDKKFGDKNYYDLEYFRYVDDFIIICESAKATQVFHELNDSLQKLGLELAELGTKTKFMSTTDFLEQTQKDTELDKVSKQHNSFLREFYELDNAHYFLSQEDWQGFLEKYQKTLSSLGIYIAIPRLSRKIEVSQSWIKRNLHYWNSTSLPEVSDLKDLDDIDSWISTYHAKNPHWRILKEIHQEILYTFFREGIDTLQTSKDDLEKSKARRKIKFSVYRLGQLGFDNYAEEISNLLIKRPWLVNIRMTTQSLGLQNYEDLLLDVYFQTPYDKPEAEYVKSCALKAIHDLPNPSKKIIDLLSEVVVSGKSSLERTAASEVLLLRQHVNKPDLQSLQDAIETDDPYLTKNLILLAKKFDIDMSIPSFDFHNVSILNEAIQFSQMNGEFDTLYQYEPDILREFYYGSYPDTSEEFREPPT